MTTTTHWPRLALVAGTAAVAILAAAPAGAAEEIRLTMVSGYPPAATWAGAVVDTFEPKVDAQLAKTGKYKILWNNAHSGQVVKPRGEIEAVQSGVADISPVPTVFHFDRVPLYAMPYHTPFTTNDVGLLANILGKMERDYADDYNTMWAALNQVNLIVTSNVDDYILFSTKPLKKLADLRGLKVGAAGANIPWITPTGAAGVQTNLADGYNSLQTGIYQVNMGWWQAGGSFKLCEPAPHVLVVGFGANSVVNLTVNGDVWKKLPAEVKQALQDNAPAYNARNIELVLNGAKSGRERCVKDYKTNVEELSKDEMRQWAKSLPPLALQWADDAEKKGYPARKMLTAYMDSMRAAKQPVLRNWDKE